MKQKGELITQVKLIAQDIDLASSLPAAAQALDTKLTRRSPEALLPSVRQSTHPIWKIGDAEVGNERA